MPKRKRDVLEDRLAHHHQELSRMLKAAKGFERQRMAKRQRDPKSNPEKRLRIDKEISVLKSLDLHSAAYAHLCASLLRVKAVAESPKLPDEVKNGVPKPEISDEEKSLLHNVTSGLYNQPKVREALDKAIADICGVLQVPVPDKKGRLKKGDKKTEAAARKNPEEQPADRKPDVAAKKPEKKEAEPEEVVAPADSSSDEDGDSDDEESEFGGFSDHEPDVEVEGKEEKVLLRFNDRLGSSDDDEYDTANEELDPMEITDVSASDDSDDDISLNGSMSGSDEEGTDEEEGGEEKEDEDEEDEGDDDDDESDSSAVSPPPKEARKEAKKRNSASLKDKQYTLPSLMGGYISGSDSEEASDIDVAPARKNRRGQRARQALAEKKFKDQAKHLAKQKQDRDDGWDMKRGAMGGGDAKTPWKKGVRTPLGGDRAGGEPRRPKAPAKKDDEGPLHASWEAAKKAKEAQETAVFSGTRVVFD